MRKLFPTFFLLAGLLLAAGAVYGAEDLGLYGAWNLYKKGQTDAAREKVLTALADANTYLRSTPDLKPEDERLVLNGMMNAVGLSLTNERGLRLQGRLSDLAAQRVYVERLAHAIERYLVAAELRGALQGLAGEEMERFEQKRERLLTGTMELLPEAAAREMFDQYSDFLERRNVSFDSVLEHHVQNEPPMPVRETHPKASVRDIVGFLLLLVFVLAGFIISQRLLHG